MEAEGEKEPTETTAIKLEEDPSPTSKMMEQEQVPSYTESQPPPGYTDTKTGPPPTYDETMKGKLQCMRDKSTGNVDYGRRVVNTFLCGTVCTLFWACILLAIPVAMIVIGALNLNNCPAEKFIPIYLIVAGVFGVLKAFANIGEWCYHRKRETSEEERKPANPFDGCVNLFLFCWFIAGSVWVYRIHKSGRQGDSPNLDHYCDNTTYWFAFWIITLQYIFALISLLFCICGCCALTCFGCAGLGKKENQEQGGQA